MVDSFARIAAASVLLSAASYFSYYFLTMRLGVDGFFVRLVEVFVPIAIGGTVFLIAAKLFGVRELNQAYDAFARRFLRR